MNVVKRYEFCGLPIAIENPVGSIRTWDAGEGKTGYTRMFLDYGFIEGYLSGDGEELDVYIGPDPESQMVHIVHQLEAPGYRKHDEDKVMLGFRFAEHARGAYLAHRSDGDLAFGGMSIIPLDRFKAKLRRRSPDATSKIHASVDTAARALVLLAGRRPSARRSASGRSRAARYEDRLLQRSVELAAKALAPDVRTLAAEIEASESFSDLRKRLVRALRGMDPAQLGEILRKTNVLARLSGRQDATEEV